MIFFTLMLKNTLMPNFSLDGSCLFLDRICLSMIIGAFANERDTAQPIEVSIALQFDHLGSVAQDTLDHTYDYGRAQQLLKKLAEKPYTLVEYLAQDLAAALLADAQGLLRGEIIISKPGAFVDIDRVGVRLRFERP